MERRREGRDASPRGNVRVVDVETGEEVPISHKVPVGPNHPILKEPLRIKLAVRGEEVVDCKVEMGYCHRGIERIMEGMPWQKAAFLAERVCGICSHAHNMCFIGGVERTAEGEPAPRGLFLRVLVQELDRIQSHLIANAAYFYSIEHETMFVWNMNTRERVLDCIEEITGNRILTGWNVVGGVRVDVTEDQLERVLETLEKVEEDVKAYRRIAQTDPLIKLRSRGVGVITKEHVRRYRVVGPQARASGVPESDMRLQEPVYPELGFKPVSRKRGDNLARILVRYDECLQSIDLIERIVDELPEGEHRRELEIRGGHVDHRVEAPRGELVYDMELTQGGVVRRVTIRTPSVPNIRVLEAIAPGAPTIADAVAVYASLDPCVACNERFVIVDRDRGEILYEGRAREVMRECSRTTSGRS
ncbi:hydrogenase large subunit [Methanopyrus sp.]